MSNWDGLLDAARSGTLTTMLPAALSIPMVAPADLGVDAADRLMSPVDDAGIMYVEGPARYSPADVADAFSAALGTAVRLDILPREKWLQSFIDQGFSESAADSYARMTRLSVDEDFELPDSPTRGTTTLRDYVSSLVTKAEESFRESTR